MKIIAVACVENRELVDEQIAKQTLQPDEIVVLVDTEPEHELSTRRKRIAENQVLLQRIVENSDADLVWQLEGDSVVEPDTLERLVAHYKEWPAIYSGVQVGRHGLYCLGAWHITENQMLSADFRKHGIKKVDGMGLYCFVMPADEFTRAKPSWDGEQWGPDVNFFLSTSMTKYVDMDLHIGHYYKGGVIMPTDAAVCNAKFNKINDKWEFTQL